MKIVYLDRDGVINKFPGYGDYVKSWEEFEFLPRVPEALKKLKEAGFTVVVISNQSGVGRGIYSQGALDEITGRMKSALAKEGAVIDDVRYCIHASDEQCACRKPNTGLFAELRSLGKDVLDRLYFIGDARSDIETAKNAGIKSILVLSGRSTILDAEGWETKPDWIAYDLLDAVQTVILKDRTL
ncbi:MAG: HAD family hydrolase [Candidatus Omnitrophica bacterium]|nr:HAD family hydrolase [Candidatus Omnitrophota bacterium]